jgi:hypothetical protein
LLRVVSWFFLDEICRFRDDGINKLLNLNSILIFIGVEDVFEGAFDEFGVDVYSFEVLHVLVIEEVSGLCLGEDSIGVFIELFERWVREGVLFVTD